MADLTRPPEDSTRKRRRSRRPPTPAALRRVLPLPSVAPPPRWMWPVRRATNPNAASTPLRVAWRVNFFPTLSLSFSHSLLLLSTVPLYVRPPLTLRFPGVPVCCLRYLKAPRRVPIPFRLHSPKHGFVSLLSVLRRGGLCSCMLWHAPLLIRSITRSSGSDFQFHPYVYFPRMMAPNFAVPS